MKRKSKGPLFAGVGVGLSVALVALAPQQPFILIVGLLIFACGAGAVNEYHQKI